MAQVENYKRSSAEKTKGFNLEAKEETLREFMTLITAFENAATSVEAATEGEEKIQGNYQARARASEIAAPPRRPDRSTDCGGARVPFRCDAACSRRDPRGDRSPSPNTHTTTRSLSRRAFSRVSPALTAGDLPRAAREVRQARPRGVPRRRRRAVRPRRTRRRVGGLLGRVRRRPGVCVSICVCVCGSVRVSSCLVGRERASSDPESRRSPSSGRAHAPGGEGGCAARRGSCRSVASTPRGGEGGSRSVGGAAGRERAPSSCNDAASTTVRVVVVVTRAAAAGTRGHAASGRGRVTCVGLASAVGGARWADRSWRLG